MAAELDPGELRAEGLAGGDQELEADQVQAGDGLGDRVLDLDAGVDLQEPELLPGEEELDRAGAHVADGAGHGQGGVAQAFAQGGADRGRRGLLDQLLVAALDRALALEQVHHAAGRVGQELDLDVARGLEPAFEEHLVVAERAPGLAAGRLDGRGQVGRVADHPHADPAAAVGRLDHQREADPLAGGGQVRGPATASPGSTGTPAAAATRLASSLSPRAASTSGGGPTKVRPRLRQPSASSARSARNP